MGSASSINARSVGPRGQVKIIAKWHRQNRDDNAPTPLRSFRKGVGALSNIKDGLCYNFSKGLKGLYSSAEHTLAYIEVSLNELLLSVGKYF